MLFSWLWSQLVLPWPLASDEEVSHCVIGKLGIDGSRTGASSGTKSETSSSSLKESSKKESILSGDLLGRYQWYSQRRQSKETIERATVLR